MDSNRLRNNSLKPKQMLGIIIASVGILLTIVIIVILNFKKKPANETSNIAESNIVVEEAEVAAKQDETKKIENLMKSFRKAFAEADVNKLKELCNVDDIQNIEQILAVNSIVKGYENLKVYIKDGLDENSKVVFLYEEYKVNNITVLVPDVVSFYLNKDEDGNYYIYLGEIIEGSTEYQYSSKIVNHIEKLKNEEDIRTLIQETEKKFSKLVKENKELESFVKKMLGVEVETENVVPESKSTEKETILESK